LIRGEGAKPPTPPTCITLEDSEPEPDLAVVIGRRLDYRDRHPNAKEIELVIEVADSSLDRDRTLKQKIYAKSGIPNYWILNLTDLTVEVYTQQSEQGIYQDCQVFPESAFVALTINQIELETFTVGNVCRLIWIHVTAF
jgi:Uma2 family endonuclease